MLGFAVGRHANSLALAATVVAMINTGDAIFGAVTEPLVGKFLDLGWHGAMQSGVRVFSASGYREALLILPLYLFIAMLLLAFIRVKSNSR